MKSAVIACLFLLAGCEKQQQDLRLEGTWTSNKEMTMNNIGVTDITEEQLGFLVRNLGQLQYVYRKDRVAITFTDMPEEPLNFKKYSIVKSEENNVVVKFEDPEPIKLSFIANCFYLKTSWGFDEYFCKNA